MAFQKFDFIMIASFFMIALFISKGNADEVFRLIS